MIYKAAKLMKVKMKNVMIAFVFILFNTYGINEREMSISVSFYGFTY